MSKYSVAKFQVGKSGLTPGVIESLNLVLKNHKQVRISFLKSSGRDRNNIEFMAEEISQKLAFPNKYKILGFTIIVTPLK